VSSSPIITANWLAASDNRWTLPIGNGVATAEGASKWGHRDKNRHAFANWTPGRREDDGGNYPAKLQFPSMLRACGIDRSYPSS